MKEIDNIEILLDGLQRGVEKAHESIRLEAMWDQSIADPVIHLENPELDDFLLTFAKTDTGDKVKKWVEKGAICEAKKNKDGEEKVCLNRAVGSIDFNMVTVSDNVLVCREDIRPVYADIVNESVRKQGVFPDITINGKEAPRLEQALSS
jgi:hypothetical protein